MHSKLHICFCRLETKPCAPFAKTKDDFGECKNQRAIWEVTVNAINGETNGSVFTIGVAVGFSVMTAAIVATLRWHKTRRASAGHTTQV